MTALTEDRNTPRRAGDRFAGPVAANVTCYAGAIAVRDSSGNLAPGSTATGLIAVGTFAERVSNGANAAAVDVTYMRGCFRLENSAAGDAITKTEIGEVCWIVDDQTVAKTSGTGTRSPAGIVADVDEQGVWVQMGYDALIAPAGALVAASNLGDLANVATARTNLGGGANKVVVTFPPISTKAADAAVVRIVSPVAGTIAKLYSVLNDALATDNATLTAKINGNAVTNGVITVTNAASAAGDVDSATPSAAHTVAVGDVISLTGGGGSTATGTATCIVHITPSA